ncbi:MAG: histidine phosphotransferase family protein [Caulobacter sp.]|jgi:histidine phosphotransferase ChpT|nr:histidine phosphotransferase family protein [Caulobacter sp.]
MTETPTVTAVEPGPSPEFDPVDLAAQLAARLCHDFISPASAIVSGLDLLDDPSAQDMREDAMALIAQSARKLASLLSFCRAAFGSASTTEVFDSRELEALASGVFAHMKPSLAWQVTPAALSKPAACATLNLAQIVGSALPAGGAVTVRVVEAAERFAISVEGLGTRIRLKPEVAGGLVGAPKGDAMGGAWIQAFYVHSLVKQAGGQVAVDIKDDSLTLAAWVPV